MGGAGRGARVSPTEESKPAPSSQPAAVFTPVVPVDHVADDPEIGAFGPALADTIASSRADGWEYVLHPCAGVRVAVAVECALCRWVMHRCTYVCPPGAAMLLL